MADLEKAIQRAQEAVDATPQDHPDRVGRLNNLGIGLGDRYARTGAIADLEEAIQRAREAVDATPQDHPNRAGRLHNLGIGLGDRYRRTGVITDLEEATRVQHALDTIQQNLDRAVRSNNLGIALVDRSLNTGATADMGKAEEIFRNNQAASNIGNLLNAPFEQQPYSVSQTEKLRKAAVEKVSLLWKFLIILKNIRTMTVLKQTQVKQQALTPYGLDLAYLLPHPLQVIH